MVGLDSLTYVGNHGLERLAPGAGEAATRSGARARWPPPCGSSPQDAFTPGLRTSACGSRTRTRSGLSTGGARRTRTAAREAAAEVAADADRDGLVPHWGRKVLEIRPTGGGRQGHRGDDRARRATQLARALYGGDDTTDLDAFRRLRALQAEGRSMARLRRRRVERRARGRGSSTRRTSWWTGTEGVSASCCESCRSGSRLVVLYTDFLKATVLLAAAEATALAVVTVAVAAARDDTTHDRVRARLVDGGRR